VVIGVILVAVLGYLYVRLSHAAAYTWLPNQMVLNNAQLTTKQSRPALTAIPVTPKPRLSATVSSRVPNDDVYCVDGYTGVAIKPYGTAGAPYLRLSSMYIYSNYGAKGTAGYDAYNIPPGNFTRCFYVKGSSATPEHAGALRRDINVEVVGIAPNSVYIFSIYRMGSNQLPPGSKN